MNNSLAKLLECVEPKIANIQETRIEIKSLSEVCKTITEIVELGKKSYLEILEYYDQEFIMRCIKLEGHNTKEKINKYKTSRYLLRNQDADVENLPQYKDSLLYMDTLYAYLQELTVKILDEYNEKAEILRQQELLNKYYIILQKENVFIPNAEEFISFLDYLKLDILDRLNILIYANRCNIKNYNKKEHAENIFISNVNLTDIKTMLNAKQLEIDEHELLDEVTEPIVENGQVNDLVISKKEHYLINEIHRLFETFEYNDAARYYKEYLTLMDYKTEFAKQKRCFALNEKEKLIFMMNDDKSLIRDYLGNCIPEYEGPILKNLLDIEKETDILIPDYCYEGTYLYIRPEFVIKTVYTYLDDGHVLVLGVLDKRKSDLRKFLEQNKELIDKTLKEKNNLTFNDEERNQVLKDVQVEDLVLTINLNMLDVKMEEENAR